MKNIPKYMKIMERITEDIRTGKYRPGDHLPTERELSEQFGVSRIVASTAMAKLVDRGIVERIQGRGSFVSSSDGKSIALQQRQRHIAMIMPEIKTTYTISLAADLQREIEQAGMHCAFYFTGNSIEAEEKLLQFICGNDDKQRMYDGMLLFSCGKNVYNRQLLSLCESNFPLVLVDRDLLGLPLFCVQTDNKLAVRLATSELIALGHRKLAVCLASSGKVTSLAERIDGFFQEMSENRMMIDPRMIINDLHKQGQRERLKEVLQSGAATAVICLNTGTYTIVKKIVEECELRCPDDISIVVIDKLNAMIDDHQVEPTCILQDTKEIVKQAVEILIEIMDRARSSEGKKILIRPSLIRGETTGPVKADAGAVEQSF